MRSIVFSFSLLFIISNMLGQEYLVTKQIGGDTLDWGRDIVFDGNGNIFITGVFWNEVNFGEDFNVEDSLISNGRSDIFLTKMDKDLNYLWTRIFGGPEREDSPNMAMDQFENVLLSGQFGSSMILGDTVIGTDIGFNGGTFISKLNNNGNLIWAKEIKGGLVTISEMEVEENGNTYITGYFQGNVDFRIGFDGISEIRSSIGSKTGFIMKLSEEGEYLWTKVLSVLPNLGQCRIFDLVVSPGGSVYITGYFESEAAMNFGSDFGEIDNLFSAGKRDAFITKITGEGDYDWTKRIGGKELDIGYGLALDSLENIYMVGWFQSEVNFSEGFDTEMNEYYRPYSGLGANSFITKISKMGNYQWSRVFGPTNTVGFSFANDVKISDNDIVIAGDYAERVDLNSFYSGTNDTLMSQGNQDLYLLGLDLEGNYKWSKGFGGSSFESLGFIALNNDELYFLGNFEKEVNFLNDFSKSESDIRYSRGNRDVFLTKLLLDEISSISTGQKESANIALYPNPFGDQITIHSNGKSNQSSIQAIELYDLSGKLILTNHFSSIDLNQKEVLKLEKYPRGAYYLKLRLKGGETVLKKLIKQ